MADDVATLDQTQQEQAWARQWRSDQLGSAARATTGTKADEATQLNVNQQRSAAQTLRQQQVTRQRQTAAAIAAPVALGEAAIQAAAIQVWTALWQRAHEFVEGLAFYFIGLPSIIIGPIAVVMYGARMIVGKFWHGGVQFNFRSIEVPLVPDIGPIEATYRGAKVAFIMLIAGLYYAAIALIVYLIQHPQQAALYGIKSIIDAITNTVKGLATGQ